MKKFFLLFSTFLYLFIISAASASPTSTTPPATDSDQTKYETLLLRIGTPGPAHIALRNQAAINLPEDYVFIPQEPAEKVMRRLGNKVDDSFVGLIFPKKKDDWFISVNYSDSGYIKDDDAKNWDTDKMLASIQQNTEESNKQRIAHGVPALDVIGWIEKPHYDEATHRMIWSIAARNRGTSDPTQNIVNYKTLMLGREGYVSMNMITKQSAIEAQKSTAALLLSKLNFSSGKSYTDFNSATDRVAAYGLAALVVGVAAKKLGLIAIVAAFLAKFIKVGILAVAGFFAMLRKKLRSKGAGETVLNETPPEQIQNTNDPNLPR